ncbi:MAG: ABC transporter ATP-binding/permease protein [Firmicutes bacterium ADurb.Bin419]|nr:MAG: ABC transporter ATP-binding/permease protein [Firmicutes bacterium ADurb.Bin419]
MKKNTTDNVYMHAITIYYENSISTFKLDEYGKSKITFGRNSDNDIVLDSSIISLHHAYFEIVDGICTVYDNNSKNGILINGVKRSQYTLANGDILRVDNENKPLKNGVVILYSIGMGDITEGWREHPFNGNNQPVYFGRGTHNNVILNHSAISVSHAVFFFHEGSLYVEDLNSTNGTYLNGIRISSAQPLKINDVVYIGDTKIIYNGKVLFYNFYSRGFRIDALSLKVDVKTRNASMFSTGKKRILDDVNLSINPGELIAVIGASGSGKTMLLRCLSGLLKPDEGMVLVNGDEFFEKYDIYKNVLGNVPQEDSMHENLTVYETLYYSANIRVTALSGSELKDEICEVIKEVQIEGLENTLIKDLSGGQRKRVSIAMELLSSPKLFFLDEPTSGLDPETEMNICMLLKKLSFDKKTVLFTTHSTSSLNICDKIAVIGKGGKLCYFGTPSKALEFFGVSDYIDIYGLVSSDSDYWEDRFKSSKINIYNKPIISKKTSGVLRRYTSSNNFVEQLIILTQRYFKLMFRDRIRLIFLLIQAPIIAIFLGLITDSNKVFRVHEEASQVILIMACSVVWMGLLNSFQEISKERSIYKREKNANLNSKAYIFSKLIVMGSLCLIQSITFVEVLSRVMKFPVESISGALKPELNFTVFLTGFAASVMGLFISSLVRNNDRAIGIVPIVMIFQIMFSGLLFKTEIIIRLFSYAALSKWSANALGTSININDIPYKSPLLLKSEEAGFVYSIENLLTNWFVLAAFAVLFAILIVFALDRAGSEK